MAAAGETPGYGQRSLEKRKNVGFFRKKTIFRHEASQQKLRSESCASRPKGFRCVSCVLVSQSPELHSDLHPPNLAHVTCGSRSVLLWRRCDTLCTSGFMVDVIFVHKGQE